jgi:hypothetical protein
MFTGQKYVTKGVQSELPSFLQNILWYLIETMEVAKKDYLQVFELSYTCEEGISQQKIMHTQEQPEYRKEYAIHVKSAAVTAKIFVIDDTTHCTMLLAEEY